MVTGIDPWDALRDGVTEAGAFARIHDEMSRPGTCVAGYNSLRFDDEFIRHGLFRNFFDPYEREWRGGNCRWDLLDVMRLAHALRLGHGGDERDGLVLVGVVERGEVLGVVERGNDGGGIGRECVGGWWNAQQSDLLPEADARARGMGRSGHGDLRR